MTTKRYLFSALRILLVVAGLVVAAAVTLFQGAVRGDFGNLSNISCIVAVVLLSFVVLIEVVSMFKISDSTKHTIYMSASLLLFAATAENVGDFLISCGAKVPATLFEDFNFFFFICSVLFVLYFLNFTYSLKISKREAIFLAAFAAVAYVAYVSLTFIKYQYIPCLIYEFAALGYYVVRVRMPVYDEDMDDGTFHLTCTILFALIGAETCNSLANAEVLYRGACGYLSLYSIVIVLLFVSVYISFIIRSAYVAQQASEYQLQSETLKSQILREQIKPHFIFNTLAVIKSMYHKNVADGDRAIDLFSRHLRSNVNADDLALIPFEKELDNIQTYVDLVNLRYDEKFNVVFNVDVTDFDVPALSLQPFVENAIKYSKVNAKEDGYIEISSTEDGDSVILEINDNGAGFDPKAVPETSCGIRNARERYEILLHARVKITSAEGAGTQVKITINRGG